VPLSFGERPVEAVLFDLDDVLVPFQTVHAWQWAWRPQGPLLGNRRVTAAIRTRLKAWDKRRWQGLTGQAPAADVGALREHLAATLDAIAGHAVAPEESAAVVRRFLRPASEAERFADAAPTLEKLRALEVKVGILTHLPAESATWLLRRAGLPDGLLLGAGDAGAPTIPDAAAFRAAADRLGASPGRTVFVGDLLWSDVRAAHRAGLLPILLDRHDAWPNVQADRTADLASLEATLRAGPIRPTDAGTEPAAEP
jgi:HAD superfamily hydrolase (TIGR01549 family)